MRDPGNEVGCSLGKNRKSGFSNDRVQYVSFTTSFYRLKRKFLLYRSKSEQPLLLVQLVNAVFMRAEFFTSSCSGDLFKLSEILPRLKLFIHH